MAKLVAIGDSLTQGFQSGSICHTHLSYPALLARAMGIPPEDFCVPNFQGEGGLPINLERIVHYLAEHYGEVINPFEFWLAMFTTRNLMDRIEDYWERGPGNGPSDTGPLHHNLAVWGFEVSDADTLTEQVCRRNIPEPRDDLFQQIPEAGMYRTARRVLNPAFRTQYQNLTQIDAARAIKQRDGEIENLIFWLGANNCLGTVLDLEIRLSEDADLHRYAHERRSNLWRPTHFEQVYRRVADKVAAIGAKFVFVGNVPHVTIPPVTRGVNLAPDNNDPDGGYYDYYTRFWVWDEDFRKEPSAYHYLTRDDARRIDQTIDQYNQIIERVAREREWQLVDVCGLLDSLAYRRNRGTVRFQFPLELAQALRANPATAYLAPGGDDATDVKLDTRFLMMQEGQLQKGGLFSLDGVHMTTIGYAVLAGEFLRQMNAAWKQAGMAQHEPGDDWWASAVARDKLVTLPPDNLKSLRELLTFLSGRGFLRDLLQAIGGKFLR